MSATKPDPVKLDPARTYLLQVREGCTAIDRDGLAFGDRCTLQVAGRDITAGLLACCDIIAPHQIPDMAER